jgi:hypothetical protein
VTNKEQNFVRNKGKENEIEVNRSYTHTRDSQLLTGYKMQELEKQGLLAVGLSLPSLDNK